MDMLNFVFRWHFQLRIFVSFNADCHDRVCKMENLL